MKYDIPYMTTEAVSLLKSLISIPSISREETQAADFLQNYIEMAGMQTGRKGNNPSSIPYYHLCYTNYNHSGAHARFPIYHIF